MPKPSEIVPRLVKTYVDALVVAEKQSEESFLDIEPDFTEFNKVMQEIPIKHRREYMYWFNELMVLVEKNSCKHPEDQLEGDEKTKRQECKVCGYVRFYNRHKVPGTDDDYFSPQYFESWGGWHKIVTQEC